MNPKFSSNMSAAEKLKWYKNKKKEKNRLAVHKHRQSLEKPEEKSPTNEKYIKHVERKRIADDKKELTRILTNERVMKFRAKSRIEKENGTSTNFKNKMQKCRAVKRAKDTIKQYTPERRSIIISSIIHAKSPDSLKTRKRLEFENIVKSDGERIREKVADAVLSDVQASINVLREKSQKTEEIASCFVGNNVEKQKLKVALANEASLNSRLVNRCLNKNKKLMSGELDPKDLSQKRKPRKDRLGEDICNRVTAFWIKNSQPVNDKKHIVRERIGPKQYRENPKHILTSTQTNIYQNFLRENPDVKIGQRRIETLKPFYVKNAKRKDRIACLCKQHVEMTSLFKKVKEVRLSLLKEMPLLSNDFTVWESLSDLADETLCPPIEINGETMFHLSCLRRECDKCGVHHIKLMAQELDDTSSSVNWNRYEYSETGKRDRNGKIIKKQQFVNLKTSMKKLWDYVKVAISTFPLHNFSCFWQKKQLENIIDNLPEGHIVMIHDYSEDFKCELQDEIQSDYFSRNEVSIHVTVLFRHEVEDSFNTNRIVKEYAFVIFDSNTHDRDTIHHVRKLLINDYLKDELNYNLKFIHEFTDGCSQQYKSKFCMRDVSFSEREFGCLTQRNYFETSHGKGEQDAAGSHIKNKAHMSVIRRECKIENGKDLFLYLDKNFRNPTTFSYKPRNEQTKLKRRLFFYAEDSQIERQRYDVKVKAVKGNRKLHCVCPVPGKAGSLFVRKITCYCLPCIHSDYQNCLYKRLIEPWEKRNLVL